MPSYVVTGASRGLGLEWVRQLSKKPDNVVFGIVRDKAGATELAKLKDERANVHILEANLIDYNGLKAAAEQVAAVTGGTLEYLINNAAYMSAARSDYSLDTYAEKNEIDVLEKDMFDFYNVNVLGFIHCVNAFLQLLKAAAAKTTAKVIALSSGVGDLDFTVATHLGVQPGYAISKAAMNMAVAKYTARFVDENFIFLSISPGLVNTMTRAPTQKEEEYFLAFSKMLKGLYPDWEGVPLTPERSVKHMLDVIAKAERKDSGAFISHFGNKQWV